MINEFRFDDRQSLLESLYDCCVSELNAALQDKKEATLLLSGGSTPGPLYQRLASADVAWQQVSVALVDERWRDTDDPASNEKLLRETLLVKNASAARFIGMKNTADTPFSGVAECCERYALLPQPFTFCLLGMGGDGHTASLFPNAIGLDDALVSRELCAAIEAHPSPVTGDNLLRMTLTPWAILKSQKTVLLITGEDKWDVYQQAKSTDDQNLMPVSILLQQDAVDIDVYWAP